MAVAVREKILLIGDTDRQLHAALSVGVPTAQVKSVAGIFEGIHELSGTDFSAVMAAAEPIERRPEAAVRTLRELVGRGRLLLFGHPTLEPLSRKMLEFGVDDYVVTPASPGELQQVFGVPTLRLAKDDSPDDSTANTPSASPSQTASKSKSKSTHQPGAVTLLQLPLAELLLDALQSAKRAPAMQQAVQAIDAMIAPKMRLDLLEAGSPIPAASESSIVLSHAIWADNEEKSSLHLTLPRDDDQTTARHFLAQLSHLATRVISIQERQSTLQHLAITDDLTGLYNGRYFRHILSKVCNDAKQNISLVPLLLFDIDNFKKYNDEYGHALGDDILRQTASLIRRCCRPRDMVFRIAGDEFAVIFMEKEPPRQPIDPGASSAGRTPIGIRPILERFQRGISSPDFAMLGATGRGTLTISGGLAIFPHHASTPEALVAAADHALMFNAKRRGKNSIHLVGGDVA
ncbi:MAG TPA: GGDEF domain-containing protein [Tepidisphaeraceae bacterium]|nr:GGDEF domain-containing protein [Tepidisphaeraceae bacterium]